MLYIICTIKVFMYVRMAQNRPSLRHPILAASSDLHPCHQTCHTSDYITVWCGAQNWFGVDIPILSCTSQKYEGENVLRAHKMDINPVFTRKQQKKNIVLSLLQHVHNDYWQQSVLCRKPRDNWSCGFCVSNLCPFHIDRKIRTNIQKQLTQMALNSVIFESFFTLICCTVKNFDFLQTFN
jgi:hypothetical protein